MVPLVTSASWGQTREVRIFLVAPCFVAQSLLSHCKLHAAEQVAARSRVASGIVVAVVQFSGKFDDYFRHYLLKGHLMASAVDNSEAGATKGAPGTLSDPLDEGSLLVEKELQEDESSLDQELACCGICLEPEFERGKLDSCDHLYCFPCIREWADVESRCPMCKRRFQKIERDGLEGRAGAPSRPRVIRIPMKDQVYMPSEEALLEALRPYANTVCTECQLGDHEELLLLCEGCDAAAHTYCVGLRHTVPRGDWFCAACQGAAGAADAAALERADPLPVETRAQARARARAHIQAGLLESMIELTGGDGSMEDEDNNSDDDSEDDEEKEEEDEEGRIASLLDDVAIINLVPAEAGGLRRTTTRSSSGGVGSSNGRSRSSTGRPAGAQVATARRSQATGGGAGSSARRSGATRAPLAVRLAGGRRGRRTARRAASQAARLQRARAVTRRVTAGSASRPAEAVAFGDLFDELTAAEWRSMLLPPPSSSARSARTVSGRRNLQQRVQELRASWQQLRSGSLSFAAAAPPDASAILAPSRSAAAAAGARAPGHPPQPSGRRIALSAPTPVRAAGAGAGAGAGADAEGAEGPSEEVSLAWSMWETARSLTAPRDADAEGARAGGASRGVGGGGGGRGGPVSWLSPDSTPRGRHNHQPAQSPPGEPASAGSIRPRHSSSLLREIVTGQPFRQVSHTGDAERSTGSGMGAACLSDAARPLDRRQVSAEEESRRRRNQVSLLDWGCSPAATPGRPSQAPAHTHAWPVGSEETRARIVHAASGGQLAGDEGVRRCRPAAGGQAGLRQAWHNAGPSGRDSARCQGPGVAAALHDEVDGVGVGDGGGGGAPSSQGKGEARGGTAMLDHATPVRLRSRPGVGASQSCSHQRPHLPPPPAVAAAAAPPRAARLSCPAPPHPSPAATPAARVHGAVAPEGRRQAEAQAQAQAQGQGQGQGQLRGSTVAKSEGGEEGLPDRSDRHAAGKKRERPAAVDARWHLGPSAAAVATGEGKRHRMEEVGLQDKSAPAEGTGGGANGESSRRRGELETREAMKADAASAVKACLKPLYDARSLSRDAYKEVARATTRSLVRAHQEGHHAAAATGSGSSPSAPPPRVESPRSCSHLSSDSATCKWRGLCVNCHVHTALAACVRDLHGAPGVQIKREGATAVV
eukprot:jgi/Mesen1/6406/ME000329S05564